MDTSEQDDAFDPLVATQFRVLDDIDVPELQLPPGPVATAAQAPVTPIRPSSRFLMAAAATIVAVAGLGGLYAVVSSSASEDDAVSAAADATTTLADDLAARPASLPAVPTTETARVDPADESDAVVEQLPTTSSSSAPAESNPTEKPVEPTPTTSTNSQPTNSLPTNSQPTNSLPTNTQPTSSLPGSPRSTVPTEIVKVGPLVNVVGTVTEVHTDCGRRLFLNADNEVEARPGILCDGGSFVFLGELRIHTATGFVVPGTPIFNKHLPDLQPGTTVSIIAVAGDNNLLNLSCDECGIAVAIEG